MKASKLKQGDQLVKDEGTYQVAGDVIEETGPGNKGSIMLWFEDKTCMWFHSDDEVQTMAESWRVDYTTDNIGWATNSLVYKTKELAEDAAIDKSWVWSSLKGYRIVPARHPDREPVDYEKTASQGFIMRDLTAWTG